jgi:hypothetical protein
MLKTCRLNYAYLPFHVWFVFIWKPTWILKLSGTGRLRFCSVFYHVKKLIFKSEATDPILWRVLFSIQKSGLRSFGESSLIHEHI